MNRITNFEIVEAMHAYGGSFAQAIASAFNRADAVNFERLKAAFPELWAEYKDMAELIQMRQTKESSDV